MRAFNTKGEGACLRCCAASTLRWTVQVASPVIGRPGFEKSLPSRSPPQRDPPSGGLSICVEGSQDLGTMNIFGMRVWNPASGGSSDLSPPPLRWLEIDVPV